MRVRNQHTHTLTGLREVEFETFDVLQIVHSPTFRATGQRMCGKDPMQRSSTAAFQTTLSSPTKPATTERVYS